ncbi:MAG: amidohydrolase [Candidatus Pacebacteria bacterium]|nr:amidohydrolase [Candidatus Paceibacterota bacterium]
MNDQQTPLLNYIRQGVPLNHVPIIDCHAHLGISSDFYYIPYNTPRQMVAHMERVGVDHLVTFTIAVGTDPAPGNRYQYQAAKLFPRKFTALTLLRGDRPDDWPTLIDEGIENGARGLKLICHYQGVRESDVDWTPAFERIRNRKAVVLNHSWETPERLRNWAERFPDITFIIGHAYSGHGEIVAQLRNVYMSTCASFVTPAFASVTELWQSMPVEKILFGTDCQDLDLCLSIGSVAYARAIPEEDKRQILGGNAMRLMKQLDWPVECLAREND